MCRLEKKRDLLQAGTERVSSCCRSSPCLGGRETGNSKKRSSAAEGLEERSLRPPFQPGKVWIFPVGWSTARGLIGLALNATGFLLPLLQLLRLLAIAFRDGHFPWSSDGALVGAFPPVLKRAGMPHMDIPAARVVKERSDLWDRLPAPATSPTVPTSPAASTASAGAGLLWSRFIHGERPALELGAVQRLDGLLGLLGAGAVEEKAHRGADCITGDSPARA